MLQTKGRRGNLSQRLHSQHVLGMHLREGSVVTNQIVLSLNFVKFSSSLNLFDCQHLHGCMRGQRQQLQQ